jgi:hypothetical protein
VGFLVAIACGLSLLFREVRRETSTEPTKPTLTDRSAVISRLVDPGTSVTGWRRREVEYLVAQRYASVADMHSGTGNQTSDLILALAAKGAAAVPRLHAPRIGTLVPIDQKPASIFVASAA